MPVTDPLVREVYARARPNRMPLHAIEITHAGLAQPLRFITGTDEDLSLPPALSVAPVLWTALAFGIIPPDASVKDGPGEGKLTLDGVSDKLRPHVMALASTGTPATIDYYNYEVAFISGVPNIAGVTAPLQVYRGLLIRNVQLGALSATATIAPKDHGNQNFPRLTFDRDTYPALHG